MQLTFALIVFPLQIIPTSFKYADVSWLKVKLNKLLNKMLLLMIVIVYDSQLSTGGI